jgi:class 3 adenylate cyclase
MGWKKQEATNRIKDALASCANVSVSDLVRETDLTALPLTTAYRVTGAHIYVDIVNAAKLLDSDNSESERAHKRFLRFLHVLQRVAHTDVFSQSDAVKVDFQNARLHFIVYRPYGSTKKRIVHAVAVATELARMIENAGALHEELADPIVSVGIESGVSLAVYNGTRGDRESLFVGRPANRAAKLLGASGVYLGEEARKELGEGGDVATAMPDDILDELSEEADLPFDQDDLEEAWNAELDEAQQAIFEFSRPTPPLSDLALHELTPANSRRLEAAFFIGDLDGFTAFVDTSFETGREDKAVQILHVARKEFRDVLNDFGGRKVRYVGDAIHGVLAEGFARETDLEATTTSAAVCAAAMRSSFELIKELEPASADLGLQIGVEVGPVSLTRLGVQGSRSACAAGRAVIQSERLQRRAAGDETRLGKEAMANASRGVRAAFPNGVHAGLEFAELISILRNEGESVRRFGVESVAPVVSYPRAHSR